MSDPEITRRCSVCGATVRQRALFCPQCGQPIDNQPTAAKSDFDIARTIAESGDSHTQMETVQEPLVDSSLTPAMTPDLPATEPLRVVVPQTRENVPTPAIEALSHAVAPRAGYDSSVRGRVGKLRRASSVVIDQAAYDPSLRFLLVAAGLFLLFLLLLILSEVIG